MLLSEEQGLKKAIEAFLEQDNDTEDALREFIHDLYSPLKYAEYFEHVVKSLVTITHPYYASLPKEKKPAFLRYLIAVLKVSSAVKVWEENFSRADAVLQFTDKPLVYANLVNIIEPLTFLQKAVSEFEPELSLRRLLLVEGQSEESFIRRIQLKSAVLNAEFDVKAYEGKGQVQNLIRLVQEKNKEGIRVDLAYDKDGHSDSFLDKLKKSCEVQSYFGFERDFENSFPSSVLRAAVCKYMEEYEKYTKVPPSDLTGEVMESLMKHPKPFVLAFRDHFGMELSKPKLGEILANDFLADGRLLWEGTVAKSDKECSEIGRFLRFALLQW